MESLPKDTLLEFNPSTLEDVRKVFNLDKPGRVDEAIDILEEWVKKQSHFEKKDFSREYLEITLITTKGLIERAKNRLDKLCTFKTLLPQFFKVEDAKTEFAELRKFVSHAHLPKVTKDNYRVYLFKINSVDADSSLIFTYYKNLAVVSEYLRTRDYVTGFIIILDFSDVNIMNFVTKFNVIEFRQAFTVLTEGYGLRVKGIHFLTPSKMVDTLVSIFKQVLSEKIGKRIQVHKTVETLYEFVPKEILPREYGGKEKSLDELNDAWLNVITSEEHMSYMKIMNQAKTNESYRQEDKLNENYASMPGSFRSLAVD